MVLQSTFGAVILASVVSALVTTSGILVIRQYERWAQRQAIYFISFAAGVLTTVSFLHLIPESFEMSADAPAYILAGFLALYLSNCFLNVYLSNHEGAEERSVGLIPMLGIGLHSFVDGVIYSVTFNVSIFTGVIAALGMVLHEFPEGILTFVFLKRGGFKRRRATLYAFAAAALTTPLGTLLSFPFINRIEEDLLGKLMAAAAGALTYVGATHLLPKVGKERGTSPTLALAAGVVLGVLVVALRE